MLAYVSQRKDILLTAGAVYIGLQMLETVPVQCRFQTASAHMIDVFVLKKPLCVWVKEIHQTFYKQRRLHANIGDITKKAAQESGQTSRWWNVLVSEHVLFLW